MKSEKFDIISFALLLIFLLSGEVAEWFKAHDWRSCVG